MTQFKAVPVFQSEGPQTPPIDFRYLFAYHFLVDKHRENGVLQIAAPIVAAIRLRGQEIKPKLTYPIKESVQLAAACVVGT
jgi:hypothetical protein